MFLFFVLQKVADLKKEEELREKAKLYDVEESDDEETKAEQAKGKMYVLCDHFYIYTFLPSFFTLCKISHKIYVIMMSISCHFNDSIAAIEDNYVMRHICKLIQFVN